MRTVRLFAISQINARGVKPAVYRDLVVRINERKPGLIVNAVEWQATERSLSLAPYTEAGLINKDYYFDIDQYPESAERTVYDEQRAFFDQQVRASVAQEAVPFLVGGSHELSLPLYQTLNAICKPQNSHGFYYNDFHLDAWSSVFFAGGFITHGFVNQILNPADTFCFGINVVLMKMYLQAVQRPYFDLYSIPQPLRQFALDNASRREPMNSADVKSLDKWLGQVLFSLDGGTRKYKKGVVSSAFFNTVMDQKQLYIQTARRFLEVMAFIERGGTIFDLSLGRPLPQDLFWSFDTDVSMLLKQGESKSTKESLVGHLRGKNITGLHVTELDQPQNAWSVDDVTDIIIEVLDHVNG